MPGDAGPPVLGYTRALVTGRITTTRDRYERFGPVSWLRALGRNWVWAQGPEACGEVLQNRNKAFDTGPGWGLMIGPFFDRGLMLLDGTEHHAHRRIMQEAFTADRLKGYLAPLNDTVAEKLDAWPRSGEVHFYRAVKQLTLDVATSTFMGEEAGAEADSINTAFVDSVRGGTALIRFPVPRLRWARGLHGRRVLENYLRPRVTTKRAGDGTDLFTALCHAEVDGERFTDDDVVNHMIFLLMAAHDTSTITLTTMAYHLARNPEWQERARAESELLGANAVAYDDLERLETIDRAMKEALRLIVPVPVLMRYATKDTEIQGYPVPAGTYITNNLYSVHRFEEWWPEPDRFDPGRFAPERKDELTHRNAFMPFGNGVHKCIGMYFGGMEVKAVLHQLLLRYRLEIPDGYEMPVDWTSLPRPSDGLPVTLRPL